MCAQRSVLRLQTRDKDTGDTADMTAEGARSEQAHDSIAATDEIHVSATDETHVGAERGRRVRLRTREGHRGYGRGVAFALPVRTTRGRPASGCCEWGMSEYDCEKDKRKSETRKNGK